MRQGQSLEMPPDPLQLMNSQSTRSSDAFFSLLMLAHRFPSAPDPDVGTVNQALLNLAWVTAARPKGIQK